MLSENAALFRTQKPAFPSVCLFVCSFAVCGGVQGRQEQSSGLPQGDTICTNGDDRAMQLIIRDTCGLADTFDKILITPCSAGQAVCLEEGRCGLQGAGNPGTVGRGLWQWWAGKVATRVTSELSG